MSEAEASEAERPLPPLPPTQALAAMKPRPACLLGLTAANDRGRGQHFRNKPSSSSRAHVVVSILFVSGVLGPVCPSPKRPEDPRMRCFPILFVCVFACVGQQLELGDGYKLARSRYVRGRGGYFPHLGIKIEKKICTGPETLSRPSRTFSRKRVAACETSARSAPGETIDNGDKGSGFEFQAASSLPFFSSSSFSFFTA
ncbi:hypothetical protein LX36DRAFT_408565 [Colletotrichum falcatum]|nr:hypothetical protein LX36DRAFT_408565 [Colletotrichum falcatum]